MRSTPRFWRNVTLIGIAHTAVIVGLVRWSGGSQQPASQKIVWLGGAPADAGVNITSAKTPMLEPTPSASALPQTEEDQPILTAAKSEIQLPLPTSTPTATPKPKPSVTPAVKATPPPPRKPKPRPTATPKPRPRPRKLVIAKASPRPTVTREEPEPEAPSASPVQTPAPVEATATAAAHGEQSGAGGSGHGGSGASQSQFGWYGSMLHDRFYSEWAQPTNVDLASAKNSVLVKLRIEKDGRVSNFEIVRASGNAAVDDSVRAAAKRVAQVDPLPSGLGTGDHYDVKIKFELSSD